MLFQVFILPKNRLHTEKQLIAYAPLKPINLLVCV